MSETLSTLSETASKQERYALLISQLKSLTNGEEDLIANLANIAAAIKQSFNFLWVGFYFVKGEQLVLGPFQGTIACSRINFGQGVCGTCWKKEKMLNVPDVDKFPGHIACSNESKSEIVLPIFKEGKVFIILDIDSDETACFDKKDEKFLKEIAMMIEGII